MMSLQDDLIVTHGGRGFRRLAARFARIERPVPTWVGRLAFWGAQRGAERMYSQARRSLLKYDEQMETALAFSGRGE
jgi:preprotein translocase subunit SecA